MAEGEGGGEDDAILKSRTTSSSFPPDYPHAAAIVEELATVCSEMTGASADVSYYPPLEAILGLKQSLHIIIDQQPMRQLPLLTRIAEQFIEQSAFGMLEHCVHSGN